MILPRRARTAILAATGLLTACVAEPPPLLGTPAAIGVIAEVEVIERHGDGGVLTYTLEDGTQVTIDQRTAAEVGPGAVAGEGRLLIAGQSGGQPWWLALVEVNRPPPHMPPGCFDLSAHATDRGDTILFDFGLALPKAPNFDPGSGPDDGRYDAPGGMGGPARFCLNIHGEVMWYGG